jgi:hypothetical protein
MKTTSLAFERRAARLVTAATALLGITLVAACDNERPVEPAAPVTPTTASAARYTSAGALTWKLTDTGGNLIAGAQFKVTNSLNVTWFVTDNGQNDADLTPGKFKLQGLPGGPYTTCQSQAPAGYVMPFLFCITKIVSLVPVDLGAFTNQRLPILLTEYIDYAKTHIGGGTFTVKDSTGAPIQVVTDNAALDLNKIDGRFRMMLPKAGKYTVCETTPPLGYVFPTGQVSLCTLFVINNDESKLVGPSVIDPPFSVVWSVIDGFHDPFNKPGWIGPSEFTVKSDDGGAFSATVLDNGVDDMHPMLGVMYVRLPGPGKYAICQVTPVTGHWLPNPLCHSVTVVLGVRAWGDYFINPEAQVPSP